MAKRKVLEKDVQKAILEYLSVAYPNLMVWRNNTGAMVRPAKGGSKRGFVRFSMPGVSDIIGFVQEDPEYNKNPVNRLHTVKGRFIAIEVKVPGKKNTLTPNQKGFLELVKSADGISIVAESIEDVKRGLEERNLYENP